MLKDLDLRVPNINQRQRVPQQAIQVLVDHIASTFNPEKIILFGSYAYGTPMSWSDVDLLVIFDAPNPKQAQRDIYLSFEDSLGVDLLVRTPQEVEQRLQMGDFFLRDIVAKGKILYERPDSGVGTES